MNLHSRVQSIERRLRNNNNQLGRVKIWNSKQEYEKAKQNGEIKNYTTSIIDNITRKQREAR